MPDFALETAYGAGSETSGTCRVVGIDEAGRGPWAGPVVAAAVWLDPARLPLELSRSLDDSKKLTAAKREDLYAAMCDLAGRGGALLSLAVGEASVAEIDRLNILQATLLAMCRAVAGLGFRPDLALVDGNRAPALRCRVETVVGGDAKSLSIAAASVVAKVTRDRAMGRLAEAHPGYGWERNAGYGTAEHRAALIGLGVTPHHRRSFRPVREALNAI
jgi:ribonuclease HII